MSCKARQMSDQMNCHQCGLIWDMNDPSPPACKQVEVVKKEAPWRIYERLTTGQMFAFQRLRPGMYRREDGVEMNVVQLNANYEFRRRDRVKSTYKNQYTTSPNGFTNRVTKAKQ